jgi:hypothetical protein
MFLQFLLIEYPLFLQSKDGFGAVLTSNGWDKLETVCDMSAGT